MDVLFQKNVSLWSQKQQLEGSLVLTPNNLQFLPHAFENSHLEVNLALKDVHDIQVFLLYGIACNGLKVTGKDGNYDLFVLEDNPVEIKRIIQEAIQLYKTNSSSLNR
jgi:hypothetical protein